MKHQVIRLEIRDELFIVWHLSFSYPDLLQLTEVLKKFFCVLGEFCLHKLPLSVIQWSVVRWLLHARLVIGWDYKGDLLVIESVHDIWNGLGLCF